jgi:hypothetical protein
LKNGIKAFVEMGWNSLKAASHAFNNTWRHLARSLGVALEAALHWHIDPDC